MLRFTIRDVLWLTALVAVALGIMLYAKRPALSPVEIGRFQMIDEQKSGYVFLLDTATGKLWMRYQGEWRDDHSPALRR